MHHAKRVRARPKRLYIRATSVRARPKPFYIAATGVRARPNTFYIRAATFLQLDIAFCSAE